MWEMAPHRQVGTGREGEDGGVRGGGGGCGGVRGYFQYCGNHKDPQWRPLSASHHVLPVSR